MPGFHAKISFSALSRIAVCPGSVKMCEPYLDAPPTEESAEGDAAHWVALQYGQGEPPALGSKAPNGVVIDNAMIDGGELWLSHTFGFFNELPVEAPRIHDTECGGTPDGHQYDEATHTLHVAEYKYGHRYVETFENFQLIGQAVGIMDQLDLDEQFLTLVLSVVQPRCPRGGPIRTWTIAATHIRAHVNVLRNSAYEALGDNPRCITSAECLDCNGRQDCTTLQTATSHILEWIGEPEATNLSGTALGTELSLIEDAIVLLKARHTGLQTQTESRIRRGEVIVGWGMESTPGRLAWTMPADQVIELGDALEINLRKPAEPITPTQAVDRKMIDRSVISMYADRSNGAMKLVRSTDKQARKSFT